MGNCLISRPDSVSITLLLDKTATGTYEVEDMSKFSALLALAVNNNDLLATTLIPLEWATSMVGKPLYTSYYSDQQRNIILYYMSSTSLTIQALSHTTRAVIYGLK